MYWAMLASDTVGSEQGGVRPVVILQNDTGNRFSPTVIVATITSQINKAKLPTHVAIASEDYAKLGKNSTIMLEQIKTIDKKRLGDYIGTLNNKDRKNFDKAASVSIALEEQIEIVKTCLTFTSDIKAEDKAIKRWIDLGGDIKYAEDWISSRKKLLNDFECYCNRKNIDIEEFYIDEMYSNKIIKVV